MIHRTVTACSVALGVALGASLLGCGPESAAAPAPAHALPAPALPAPDTRAAPPITDAVEYLRLHNAVAAADGDDWSDALATLAAAGDAFTLEQLGQLDRADLDAEQLAQLDRALATLQARLPDGQDALPPEAITWRLERAAFADLMCDPMEATLPAWTRADIARRLDDPAVRAEVQRLAGGYTPTIEVATMFSSLGERVPVYARQILEGTSP